MSETIVTRQEQDIRLASLSHLKMNMVQVFWDE